MVSYAVIKSASIIFVYHILLIDDHQPTELSKTLNRYENDASFNIKFNSIQYILYKPDVKSITV